MEEKYQALTDLEKHIIELAVDEFIIKGFSEIDMKELAKKAGISRTTLYRHFSSKEALSFYVTIYILLYRLPIDVDLTQNCSGYEKLCQCTKSMCSVLSKNLAIIRYIANFDLSHAGNYPDIPESTYLKYTHTPKTNSAIQHNPISMFVYAITEGQKDQSIHSNKPPQFIAFTLCNAIKAMAASVVLREEHLLQEQGYGAEMLDYMADLLLQSLKS